MTDRFWICIYNHPTEGLRGVAGEGTGAAVSDIPFCLANEEDLAAAFNPPMEDSGLYIFAGAAWFNAVRDEVQYDGDPNSPAPEWRRLNEAEIRAIGNGETPREMSRWLAGEAWAE